MNSQELSALQEAYSQVYELDEVSSADYTALAKTKKPRSKESIQARYHAKRLSKPEPETGKKSPRPSSPLRSKMTQDTRDAGRLAAEYGSYDEPGYDSSSKGSLPKGKKLERQKKTGVSESFDLYDIILSHLLDEGYADTEQAAEAIMVNMSEDWRQDIMEKEDSEYEKASDAALDKRYGYGRASGDKRSFGRAANRSSAAAALRAIRRGERSGSGTSREAGSDAVHQGWAKTAKTSADQTPEKKERRAGLANTPYSKLPEDEKEKDRVSFDAVRATYNKNKK